VLVLEHAAGVVFSEQTARANISIMNFRRSIDPSTVRRRTLCERRVDLNRAGKGEFECLGEIPDNCATGDTRRSAAEVLIKQGFAG